MMNNVPIPRRASWRRAVLAACVLAACASTGAAPTLPQVVAGQASFSQQGNVFSITNTPNTVINWQSFSIAAGDVTRFIQQDASSAVLNRIVGQDPSKILGALQSNGQVFLINPNGIMFGKDARIDVGGLAASTLDMTNADFLAGRRNFSASGAPGAIANAGIIRTPVGGQVFLVAPDIENSGVISAPNGQVVLAAGRSVQLVEAGNPDLHVVVSAPSDRAVNLGQLAAPGGRIGIYGALVRQQGQASADSAVVGENGRIVLRASGDVQFGAGSASSATSVTVSAPAITIDGAVASRDGALDLTAAGGKIVVGAGGTVDAGAGALTAKADAITNDGTISTTSGAIAITATTIINTGEISSSTGAITLDGSVNDTGRIRSRGKVSGLDTYPGPNLTVASCVARPTQIGCDALIQETLDACVIDPSGADCSLVLPTLSECIASPTTYGCTVVLPTLTQCKLTPTATGCSVVLPSLSQCVASPTLDGCSVVLPTLAQCTSTPTLEGCSVVLPTLNQCIADPTLGGCSAVLPTIAQCTANPSQSGCSVVLPSLNQCIANPALAGCSVVLPTLTACTATPTLPGCSVVLPTLAQCTSSPTLQGCSAVLPSLATCVAAPTTAGCSVVLPTIAQCTTAPTTAGCSAVLPTLAECVATPTLAGCTAVLPSVALCAATPTAPGCVTTADPIIGADPGPVQQTSTSVINTINLVLPPTSGSATNLLLVSTGGTGPTESKPDPKSTDKKVVDTADKSGVKNEDVAKKLYCN